MGNHPTKHFTVVRSTNSVIGLRKRNGWDYGDVFIQAHIGHNRSIEQRFFISGSSIEDIPKNDFEHDVKIKCFDKWFELHYPDGEVREYTVDCYNPYISRSGLVSVQLDSRTTAHTHINYRGGNWLPIMRHPIVSERIIFTEWDEQYHINKKSLLVRHSVNPFALKSYDMLWDNEDLEDFISVQPTKKNHCLINNRFVINTRFPEIYPWSR